MTVANKTVEQAYMPRMWSRGAALQQRLRCIPARLIENRLMLAGIGLIAMPDLADVEPIAQQIAKRSGRVRHATCDAAVAHPAQLRADAACDKVGGETLDGTQFAMSREDEADCLCLTLIGDWLERHCAAPTNPSPGSAWLCGAPAPEGRLDS